jgi:hypothetical protein
MYSKITTVGKLVFDVKDLTNKHKLQSTWKKTAMLVIDGDIAEYYAWFIKNRYNLTLNRPIRGAHISFINDNLGDLGPNGSLLWEDVKSKWDGKEIEISLDLSPKTDDRIWWLNVPHYDRLELQGIRNELGLGRPYWGMHMSIGYANERNIEHSIYLHELIKKGFIS